MVADPSGATQKDHRRGNLLRHDHRVMTCAAHHAMWSAAGFLNCFLDLADKKGVHPYDGLLQQGSCFERYPTPFGDLAGASNQSIHRALAGAVRFVSKVQ